MRLDDGRVVPNFIGQALRGEPITVYGSGEQTRSFCYQSDLIDGFWRLMNSDYVGPVNIGNPAECSILQLAMMVIDLTGSRSRIVHRKLPQDDPKQRQPDISRAQDLFDWRPRTTLEDGLQSTIAYFDRLLSDQKLRAQLVNEPAA